MSSSVRFENRAYRLPGVLLLIVSLTSCGGSGQVPVNRVSGKVLLGGNPATGATVRFVPIQPTAATAKLRPMSVVGEDGSYTLATYGYGDGAPEGQYNVFITWPTPDELTEPGEIPDDYRRLNETYGDRKKPKLRATVKKGDNEIPAFELK